MERREIEFIISRDGEIKMDIKGMQGNGCRNVAEAVKQIGQVLDEKRKPEFFEKSDAALVIHQYSGSGEPA